jgi:hypothetical protein
MADDSYWELSPGQSADGRGRNMIAYLMDSTKTATLVVDGQNHAMSGTYGVIGHAVNNVTNNGAGKVKVTFS